MTLKKLLTESALKLRESPDLFAPRIFTSLLSSAWMLALLHALEQQNTTIMITGIAVFPLIYFLGTFAPVVVAEMVKTNSGLHKGIMKSTEHVKKVAAASLLIFLLMTAVFTPVYAGLGLYLVSGTATAVLLGALITLIGAIMVSFIIYFLPITLTEKPVIESFKSSAATSARNQREVSTLVILSFLLLGLAAASSGILRGLGIAGFVAGRIISSVVGTYILVVSPKYYMDRN